MALDSLVRSGIATAKRLTASLQAEVLLKAWTGHDADTQPTYATPIALPALVEYKQGLLRTAAGAEVTRRSIVTFLAPVRPNGATGRREPIDPRDVLILPDGTTGPILEVSGLADPSTTQPYMLEVSLGYPLAR